MSGEIGVSCGFMDVSSDDASAPRLLSPDCAACSLPAAASAPAIPPFNNNRLEAAKRELFRSLVTRHPSPFVSVELDAGPLHHAGPLHQLLPDHLVELLGSAAGGRYSVRLQPVLHLLRLQDPVQL